MDRMILRTTILELTLRDLDFLKAMAQSPDDLRVGEVAKVMQASPSLATKHKKRLLELGLIEERPFGLLAFQMPLLREYILEHYLGSTD